MSEPMSLRKEWMIRVLVGLGMIPTTLLLVGGLGWLLPEKSEGLAVALGGLLYLAGSMAISMSIVNRKAN